MARPKMTDAERKQREKEAAEERAMLEAMSPEERKSYRQAKKVEAFQRVAQRRVNAALKALEGVAATGNRNTYSYTEDQANKILDALGEGLNAVHVSFRPKAPTADQGPRFTL